MEICKAWFKLDFASLIPWALCRFCCKSPAVSGFQHPQLRGVEGARKIGGILMASQTVIGAR